RAPSPRVISCASSMSRVSRYHWPSRVSSAKAGLGSAAPTTPAASRAATVTPVRDKRIILLLPAIIRGIGVSGWHRSGPTAIDGESQRFSVCDVGKGISRRQAVHGGSTTAHGPDADKAANGLPV